MLVFNTDVNRYVIDPHYLGILPFKAILDRDESKDGIIGNAQLMWLYHMYNPHSAFRDHKQSDKSRAIVEATFPRWFLDQEEKNLKSLIAEAELKNKDNDQLADTVVGQDGEIAPAPKKREQIFIPKLKLYDPQDDELVMAAAQWYKNHLTKTPLWFSYDAYKEAMYNLSKIIADPQATAQSIRAASTELDTIPLKMEKMRQQAIKDEAVTLKVTGDKNIKRGEKVETHAARNRRQSAETKHE